MRDDTAMNNFLNTLPGWLIELRKMQEAKTESKAQRETQASQFGEQMQFSRDQATTSGKQFLQELEQREALAEAANQAATIRQYNELYGMDWQDKFNLSPDGRLSPKEIPQPQQGGNTINAQTPPFMLNQQGGANQFWQQSQQEPAPTQQPSLATLRQKEIESTVGANVSQARQIRQINPEYQLQDRAVSGAIGEMDASKYMKNFRQRYASYSDPAGLTNDLKKMYKYSLEHDIPIDENDIKLAKERYARFRVEGKLGIKDPQILKDIREQNKQLISLGKLYQKIQAQQAQQKNQ